MVYSEQLKTYHILLWNTSIVVIPQTDTSQG